jgi:hypothetical protein
MPSAVGWKRPSVSEATLEFRTVTDLVTDVVNPGRALERHANKEGLAGRALFSDERREKMEGGTEVHTVLEDLRDGAAVDVAGYPVARRGYVKGITRWQQRFDRKIVDVEVEVVSDVLKVKGRIDYVRLCQKQGCGCGGEGFILGDLKVGKLVTYVTAHLQVAAYHYIWIEAGHSAAICGGEVLCVNAAGDFAVWPVLASPDAFVKAADWHAELVPMRLAVEEQKGANR